jgi:hypothetical protein
MMLSLRDWAWVGALALAATGAGCSSSKDAEQSPPNAGKGGTGGTSGGGMGGGAGTGGAKGGSGGTGGTCFQTAGTLSEPGTGGASGEAGASGASGEGGASGESGASDVVPPEPEPAPCVELPPLPALHVEGNEIKDPNGNTVILRGVAMIDLGATEVWEGGIKAMIDRLTNQDDPQGDSPGWGTKVVRLMVGPKDGPSQTPIQYEPGGDYYEKILRPAVDYARFKGLYSIIDWHYIDTTSLHIDTTNEFWADMAPRFAGDTNVLFELFNEPIDGGNWASVKYAMQPWFDTVRAGAPDNLVLIGTANWCQFVGDATEYPIDGTNVVYVAHMYPQHWDQPILRQQIATAAAQFPVFMTEWGFRENPEDELTNGTISSYGEPIKAFIEEQRLSWTAWAASAAWGPPMFEADYTLRVGEGEMGGFVKDWLWEKKDDDQPQP